MAPLARYQDDGNMSSQDLHEAALAGPPSIESVRLLSVFKIIPRRHLLTALKLSEPTLRRLFASRLPPAASGAALDLGRLLRPATNLLGSAEEAELWMTHSAVAFRGYCPFDLMATRQGILVVLDHLERKRHGVYA